MQLIHAANLLKMSHPELDDLYQASAAGEIPRGEGHGTVLVAPGTGLAEHAAQFAHRFAWQGKVFDPDRGELRNEVGPFGAKAIVAKVYQGVSWFDGKDAIILDYSQTSLIAHWIRDEIRLVAPGLYLGIAYLGHVKVVNFALSFPT
jgi:hypothetical protein